MVSAQYSGLSLILEINKQTVLPKSMIAKYAVKAFDGDYETVRLQRLLNQLDALAHDGDLEDINAQDDLETEQESITLNSKEILSVVFTIIDLLP